ncbi:hypothetical protein [Hymenobacter sp. UYP22]|uniref:hypothetical protein n=1 Tax=Hymenobacter sp. UYP22 TaxID=3156348 RepID=UPI003392A029
MHPALHHALYLGLHRAEYGGLTHYAGLTYERLLTARLGLRLGLGGIHRNTSRYTVVLNPVSGQYESVRESRGVYNSALLTSQLRYFLWPLRRPGAGLFVGAGLQAVAEEFQQDSNSPGGYVSSIQVHVPLTTRIGYQLRKGRWLLSGSTGFDYTPRSTAVAVSNRPGKGGLDVHVTTASDLEIGYAF